eukprot:INCI4359.1.p1 GENE.INCI4359.1~~INCI4359.1.p1  ORF type:complete len:159 (-),score=23.90 INCI4359.1:563-1039(-)
MAGFLQTTFRRSTRALAGLVERFLPTQGELVPALQGIPLGNHHQEEPVTTSLSDSILLFAAPKQKVSHSRRRLRQTHKWMKNDNSVYRCPTCNAFKKRHIALHCARKEEICGLGHDTHVFNMPYDEKPKGMRSTTHQYHSSMRGASWVESDEEGEGAK